MKRFTAKEMDIKDRQAVLAHIKDFFVNMPRLLFAYVHGSFPEGRAFRDVDVAAYLDPDACGTPDELFAYSLRIAAEIDLAVSNVTVDLKLLNHAPLPFRFQVINRGQVLFSRNEIARIEFEATTRTLHFDFAPHLKFYRRELFGLGG